MKPSALEDLWTVVRLAAEGSDWKRDQGETLCDWAQRKLRPTPRPEEQRLKEPLAEILKPIRNAVLEEAAQEMVRRYGTGCIAQDYIRALKDNAPQPQSR